MRHRLAEIAVRTGAALVIIACSAAITTVVFAQPVRQEQTTRAGQLFLEVRLNGVLQKGLHAFSMQADGNLTATRKALIDLGISAEKLASFGDPVPLFASSEVQASYNEAFQRLDLIVPPTWLNRPAQSIDGTLINAAVRTPAARAVIFNYDLYGQHVDGKSIASARTELSLAAEKGYGLASFLSGWNGFVPRGMSHVRLDTAWQVDDSQNMVSYTVGDFISASQNWSRSVRVGGFQIRRNFALQPYRITSALPTIQGTAVLPSSVDLFINGVRQSSANVTPGQFSFSVPPMINGAGQAQIVVTDVNGAAKTVTIPIYTSAQLLKSGEVDWAFETGSPRRNYGLNSFRYGQLSAFGNARIGVADDFTLEGHTEFSKVLQLLGMGGVWSLPSQGGIVNASGSASRAQSRPGFQGTLSYQWSDSTRNFYWSRAQRTPGFSDVGSLDDGGQSASLPYRNETVFLGFNSKVGQIGFSWLAQNFRDQAAQTYIGLSLTRQVFNDGSLSLNLNRGPSGAAIFASLSIPLGRASSYSITANRTSQSKDATLNYSEGISQDAGSWSKRIRAGVGDSRTLQAEATYVGEQLQWTVGANRTRNQSGQTFQNQYSQLSGSLLATRGQLYASRRIDNAFAIVDADGTPDLPVKLENRSMGKTDSRGFLLINNLNAYQHNKVSIETLGLPLGTRVDNTVLDIVPGTRGGALAEFRIANVHAVLFRLRSSRGEPLAVGSEVSTLFTKKTETFKRVFYVGYDGAVYIENPPLHGELLVTQPDGLFCRAELPDVQPSAYTDLGDITCIP